MERKYFYEDIKKRILEAKTVAELDAIYSLMNRLMDAHMLTACQYCNLDCMIEERGLV